jgi:GAF domain-containing protein
VITVSRRQAGAFAASEVELLQTFADQAVIAIENVRLFEEVQAKTRDLSEALQQQIAAADVFKVISTTPNDIQAVFQTILENAIRICSAKFGSLWLCEGNGFRAAALHNTPSALLEARRREPVIYPPSDSALGQVALTRQIAHIRDVKTETKSYASGNRFVSESVDLGGYRTIVSIPMLKEGNLIGAININRQEVQPFSQREIELLESFSAQAVIAIENARLLNELKESLQQQTATADVLRVISRSTFDLQKVLDTLTESACRLCDAYDAVTLLREDDFLRIAAHYGEIPVVDKWPVSRAWISGRCVVDRKPVHVHDLLAEETEFPMAHAFAQQTGHRSLFAVPLMRENEAIGAINIRRTEVRPFTDKQIELLQTFADQAVIAVENARLFREVQDRTSDLSESLKQQTATGDVLKVIASSPTNVEPALQAIVESACAFCGAYDAAVVLKIGDDLHFSAHHGPIRPGQQPRPINRQWVTGRSVVDKVPVQVSDFQAPEAAEFPEGQRQSREQGQRCTLSVPLLREGEAIGAIVLRRLEPVAFSDKQVALLQTFADQAVIAIGNVRLFDEVQRRTRRRRRFWRRSVLHLASWRRCFKKCLKTPRAFAGPPLAR